MWLFSAVFNIQVQLVGHVKTCGLSQRASVSNRGQESSLMPTVSVRNLGEKVKSTAGKHEGHIKKGYQTSLIGNLMLYHNHH